MLDFNLVRKKDKTIAELTGGLTREDLVSLTNEMVDTILGKINNCRDEDVVFDPEDPKADDPYAEDKAELNMPWTLGHVIVHLNASCEESAALAAELARGVAYHGRSRSEVPWETVTTIEACRQWLEESRKMCLASLDMWPDGPHLDNTYTPWDGVPPVNAVIRYALGLMHADGHLDQIDDVVAQAKTA